MSDRERERQRKRERMRERQRENERERERERERWRGEGERGTFIDVKIERGEEKNGKDFFLLKSDIVLKFYFHYSTSLFYIFDFKI